jgi:hypothetical protein
VRHEDSVVTGFLGEYNLDLNIAAVNVMDLPDLDAALFDYRVEFQPHSTVVAMGRDICGKLLTTFGILDGVQSEYSEKLMLSTCQISKVPSITIWVYNQFLLLYTVNYTPEEIKYIFMNLLFDFTLFFFQFDSCCL